MAIFASVAGRSRMNSLKMARPSRHDNPPIRKLKAKIKKVHQKYNVSPDKDRFANRDKNLSTPAKSRVGLYDVKGIQSLRGQNVNRTVSRGGDPQKDWMRWRQTDQAILDLLSPEAKKRVIDAGIQIEVSSKGMTGQAQYSPFNLPEFAGGAKKTLTVRSNMTADDIRHEWTHAGLDVASDMFSNVAPVNVFANTALGTFMGQSNIGWSAADQMKAAESVAITMGGQGAYPGFTPTNVPQDFSQFFNTEHASWQYPTQPGWNIK